MQVKEWFDERLHIDELRELAERKEVPLHKHSFWYYMGGITLMYIAIQVVTGILLMVYYVPALDSAHASILKINSQVEFGWFIRSMHSWGANLMIFFVVLHMFSTYFMKAYRKPRELTWLSGMILLVLSLAFGFTGYLLPWDEVSFFATKIGLDIAGKMPVVGEMIAYMLRGGSEIGQETLSRFFVIHVSVLPLLLVMLAGAHVLMVQMHGMSTPADVEKETVKKEKFFPNFLMKDLLVWVLAFNALAVVVTLFPWGLGPEADPYAPAPMGIKPEWYFLAPFQFLKLIPPRVGPIEGELFGIFLMMAVGLVIVLVPFWDRGDSVSASKTATAVGVVTLVAAIFLTIWGAMS
ncbi:MAG: cytochrome bc complex cytochrome b subunit [Candidatus Melainabacteria bacterium]|nr:cytochrome bc complex cytochrome b subunit [Candidatus Melainabacteria bacterium]